ncbi:MAG: hypothetical protein M3083_18180 [Actinomycetota bacterium]|nr:hypothetical protein [Actinomycetota bacterium]
MYLSARVRRPIEDHVVELIHVLRRQGVRTTKVEIIEMLLWSLPAEPTDQFLSLLRDFRAAAPRDTLGPA